jgi:formylglycine-generating enzyme required for sulfatase activity
MKTLPIVLTLVAFLLTGAFDVLSQETIVRGKVIDSKTQQPLVNAKIGLKGRPYNTASDIEGNFKFLLPEKTETDTFFISYIGYKTFVDRLSNLRRANKTYLLEESSTLLDEVTILEKKLYRFEIKKLEAAMKLVKGNLYACQTEVTNKEYNQFLSYLLRSNQMALYKKYKPDISQHEGSLLIFFKGYHLQQLESKENKYHKSYNDYPIVNISHEAAIAYCEWFTDLYNSTKGKKKFKKVNFRLPKLKEWQIAALGYKKFQSWELDENEVDVGIPKNLGEEVAVKKRMIPVKGSDILYPWYGVYEYRNKAQNNRNCWLGNFKIPSGAPLCQALPAAGDGYAITGKTGSYFPNGMGFFDVVGNVAEMIDEKGKAYGGSWNHFPNESTIRSVDDYKGQSGAVGFRVFMEVIEK